jgi:hypothetical protein
MDIFWNDDDEYTEVVALVIRADIGEDDILMLMKDVIPEPVPRLFGSGSRLGKAPNFDRRRVFYSHLLFQDVWGDSPVYHNATYFKMLFKIPIGLFDEIVLRVLAHDDYFRQKQDAAGKIGLSPHQKICSTVDIRCVAR